MTITIDGIPVHYLDLGEGGETALILQGWGTNISLYQKLAEHLSRSMRVLLPELPGFGETPEPPRPFSAQDYADFTLAFLRALGVSRVHLLGHSNGGRVILKLCTMPSCGVSFDKLVFLDSAGLLKPKTPAQLRKQRLFRLGKALLRPFPGLLERYRRRHGSADYRAASPLMRQTLVKLVTEDFAPLLPLVRQESLLIWGSADPDTPLWMGKVFAENIPNSGLVEVPGAGHYAHLEQPGLVHRVLDVYFQGKVT